MLQKKLAGTRGFIRAAGISLFLFTMGQSAWSQTEHVSSVVARTFRAGGDAVSADFDRDGRADVAVALPERGSLISTRYTVSVRVSANVQSVPVALESRPGGLDLFARDVDGDRDLDLLITGRFSGERVAVWVNDGSGRFSQGHIGDYPQWIWHKGPQIVGAYLIDDAGAVILSGASPCAVVTFDAAALNPAVARTIGARCRPATTDRSGDYCIRPPPQSL